jgi:hypothetical protein
VPHIWKTLGGPDFVAEVQFGEPRIYLSRRAAADATHAEIEAMRASASAGQQVGESVSRLVASSS